MKNEIQKIEDQDKENIVLQNDLKQTPKTNSKEIKSKKDTKPQPIIKNALESVVSKNTAIKGLSSEQISLIKRTVAKDATNDELAMFIHIAKKAGLDPFLKEVWFIKYKGGETIIMTGRDGFLSIAQKSKTFAGIQSAAIYEGDTFSIDYSDPNDIKIKHISNPFKKEAGKILGAWARSSRTGCIDTVELVNWKDYYKSFAGKISMWDKFGTAMIKKVAESIALKKQYGISGIVSKEEMGFENEKTNTQTLPDGNKLFEDTLNLIKQLKNKSQIKQAVDNACNSGQFAEDQIKILKNLLK